MTYLFMLLFFSVGSFASSEEEVLSQVNKALTTLKMGPMMEASCDLSKGAVCSFADMCSELSANRNSKYLYKDSEGKVIQNANLLDISNQLRECSNDLSASIKRNSNQGNQTALQASSIEQWQADQSTFKTLKKDLLASIRKNKEQSKYLAIEESMTDALVESPAAIAPGTSRSAVEQQIRGFEKRSGVTLSDESRKKWVTMLDPSNYKYQAASAPTEESLLPDDPFQNTSLLLDAAHAGSAEKLKKYQAEVAQETARTQKIFEDMRARIIRVLQSKKTSANAAQIDELIKRVQTVSFKPMENFDPSYLNQIGCDSPNAFYTGTDHSFTMCPQMINQPEASIAAVIAHEVGHAIDPCTIAEPLSKSDEGAYSVDSDGSLVARKFGFSENPLSSVISCLSSSDSVGARMADVGKIRKNLEAQIAFLKGKGAGEDEASVKSLRGTLARLKDNVEEKRACSDLPGKSEMQEAFADWVSSKVMSQKISELPEDKKKTYAVEAQGSFLGSECISVKPDAVANLDKLLEGTACDKDVFTKDMNNISNASSLDEHPDSSVRVNRIYMADPVYRKALSCNSKPEAVQCE